MKRVSFLSAFGLVLAVTAFAAVTGSAATNAFGGKAPAYVCPPAC